MKAIVIEILAAVILTLLLIVFRPMLIGNVAQAQEPYTYTYTNSTGDVVTATITPSTTMSPVQVSNIIDIAFVLIWVVALVVIILTMTGKLRF